LGSWAAGGSPTIRPLTKRPYIDGPDGLGGQHPEGCTFGMVDGSVRFINKDIDPKVLEAMTTIAGGESVGQQ
jgi:prepilin-type processing-associated H-X9-DG protein